MKRILSETRAVLLRLTACTTTSHIPETVEDSLHSQSQPHPPDQQPPERDDETLTTTTTTTTMSLQPHITKPSSYFQSLFDLTLLEYSKHTGIDLTTYPIVARLDDISSVDKVIAILRERTRPSDSKSVDPMALLMGHLGSIARMVSLLSPDEALCDNIDPVCQTGLDLDAN